MFQTPNVLAERAEILITIFATQALRTCDNLSNDPSSEHTFPIKRGIALVLPLSFGRLESVMISLPYAFGLCRLFVGFFPGHQV